MPYPYQLLRRTRHCSCQDKPETMGWGAILGHACCDPVGAHREGHLPPDQRRARRSGVHATRPPSHGRTKRAGTRKAAA